MILQASTYLLGHPLSVVAMAFGALGLALARIHNTYYPTRR